MFHNTQSSCTRSQELSSWAYFLLTVTCTALNSKGSTFYIPAPCKGMYLWKAGLMLVPHSLLPSSCSDQGLFTCTAYTVAQSEEHMLHIGFTGFSHLAPILPSAGVTGCKDPALCCFTGASPSQNLNFGSVFTYLDKTQHSAWGKTLWFGPVALPGPFLLMAVKTKR